MGFIFSFNSSSATVCPAIQFSSFQCCKWKTTGTSTGSISKWRIMANENQLQKSSQLDTTNTGNVSETDTDTGTQSGRGFGAPLKKPKPSKNRRKNDTVIRREPPEKPYLAPPEAQSMFQQKEGVFLISWAGLGILILVEGVILSASGFLPEEWDGFLLKYLYPAFTPTVVLFLAGTSAYGLYKYFGGGSQKT